MGFARNMYMTYRNHIRVSHFEGTLVDQHGEKWELGHPQSITVGDTKISDFAASPSFEDCMELLETSRPKEIHVEMRLSRMTVFSNDSYGVPLTIDLTPCDDIPHVESFKRVRVLGGCITESLTKTEFETCVRRYFVLE